MGVPQKPKTGKKCARGKKSCKAKKPMWGGSPASAMLFQDLANPTNPDNYLDADIPLVANQASARGTMTGGSLTSAAVVGAANTQRDPSARLNDYESAMDLKGCGSKAVMTGGSIASNSVMRHGSLPGVLKPDEVTRMVPDYLSLDPAARPVSSQLTGGGDRPFVLGPVPNREALRNRWARERADRPAEYEQMQRRALAEDQQRRQLLMAEQRRRAQAQENIARAQADVGGHEQERPRKRKGSSGRRSRGSSGRRSKRKPMNGGSGSQENLRLGIERAIKRGDFATRQLAMIHAEVHLGGKKKKIPADIIDLINRKFGHSVNNSPPEEPNKKPMTGGASGFWSGVAGCGPVNVPNAGNTLSKYFTKSSSCPGPDFYANPPNLGTAGSGYATELPAGAPFPFM